MDDLSSRTTVLGHEDPSLVYGFLHVLRATREAPGLPPNDVSVFSDGRISDGIHRYHEAMSRLADRGDIRDVTTKYEAVSLVLVSTDASSSGHPLTHYPVPESPLVFTGFFEKLYTQYDRRFIYAAPALEARTRRLEWDPESPALSLSPADYRPRVSSS